MTDWIKPQWDTDRVVSTSLKGEPMQAEGTKINQAPELYLATDVEAMAKGGWKITAKASVRVFDGNNRELYKHLEDMLQMGLAIAQETVRNHDEKKETTNEQ